MADRLSLAASADRLLVETEVAAHRMVEWTIQAPQAPQRMARSPLNLALVLDRSGSMAGDKLVNVKQAAYHVLVQLNAQDRVAVVAYDDEVTLLAGSTLLTDSVRQQLKARISDLQPGGWTDLSGGWLRGCDEVASHVTAQGVSRVLLLTDGLANRGITDLEELTHHARELRKRGVATSTFGVGLDFNEHLLEAMAAQGGGQFYYIEQASQIPAFFQRELGELLTVVAREAFMTLVLPPGVAVEVLGDVPHEKTFQQIKVSLGDICAGIRQSVYTRVLTPPNPTAGARLVLQAQLAYLDRAGQPQTIDYQVTLTYAPAPEVAQAGLDQAVLQRASEVDVAAATTRALKLERAGERELAQAAMQHTMAANAPYLSAPAAASANDLAEKIDRGLTEEERKSSHYTAYRQKQGRG